MSVVHLYVAAMVLTNPSGIMVKPQRAVAALRGPIRRNQHVQVACALFPESDQRLIFRRGEPNVESVHVRKFNCDYTFWLPMTAFGKFVAATVRQVPAPCFAIIGPTLVRYSSNFSASEMMCLTTKYALAMFHSPYSNMHRSPGHHARGRIAS